MSSSGAVTGIVLVGVGGQGILLAAQITARAALIAGNDVKTNEVHGMAQRGGSVVAQIRFGQKVYSPLVPLGSAQVLLSLERIEALRFAELLSPDGLAVVSRQAIVPVTVSSGQAVYPADAEERLRSRFPRLVYVDAVAVGEKLCDTRVANVVLLGALSTALSLPLESWTEAISQCVKARFVEINVTAFQEGRALAASA
ncbi:MAG TPA: indolepyruvate oxidoreductase subunit beta [Spirochaetia bacterium]|nr:indolepyruvate oxidoreductase subunit beta [Spirochaetia bacterium]